MLCCSSWAVIAIRSIHLVFVPHSIFTGRHDKRASFILNLNYPASLVVMATNQSVVRSGDIKEPDRLVQGRVLTAVSAVARDQQ